MDTKLKNRHKTGILLIILTALVAAFVTVSAYPYMERRAIAASEEYRADESLYEIDNLSPQVMNCVYALWMEEVESREGHMMTPTQVFLPNLPVKLEERRNEGNTVNFAAGKIHVPEEAGEYAEDYYVVSDSYEELQRIQMEMDEMGSAWESSFRSLLPNSIYTMYDETGKILRCSSERTLSGHESGYLSLKLTFDKTGHMTVDRVDGSSQVKAERLGSALMKYEYMNPLGMEFYYDTAYLGTPFEGPKNVSFEISLDGTLISNDSSGYDSYDILRSGSHMVVVLAMSLFVTLAALLLPCFKTLHLGEEKIFRVPFEFLFCIGLYWLIMVFSEIPCGMIYYTLNGRLAEEFVVMGFLPQAAAAFAYILNGILWFTAYLMLYWGVTCFRAVFSLGPVRYIRERTICGRLCGWLGRCWSRFYGEIKSVDWREDSTRIIRKIVILNFLILAGISCFWVVGIFVLVLYSIGLFFLLRKYWREMQEKYQILLSGINRIAEGDLDVEIGDDLGIFEPFRAQIDKIRTGFKKAVDEEVKSQSMKTELITNVSHDLKTPLTAIITYVNLLKDENITDEERRSYIQVLDQKSMRLKALIEDLFEVSKANSRNVTLNLMDLDVVNLMKQVRLELDDKISASKVDFKWNLPEEPVVLHLDSEKTYRIFENLLVNIVKYAMPGSRAYIDIERTPTQVRISMKNISAVELSLNGKEITERFVRGDKSRNTEGSGLGLAIARSFTELQKGKMEVDIEADLFKVMITWPVG